MWQWGVEPADIAPTGSDICGGEVYYAILNSVCSNVSSLTPVLLAQPSLRGSSVAVGSLDITGYGTRELNSVCVNVSSMDIGRGLLVFNGQDLVSTNTNVLRFDGDVIGAADTINKMNDASIYAPAVVEVDGGDASEQFEVLDGGDADENT